MIVVSYVQYSTGYRFVLRELADLAHAHGALLAVDATQAAGMAPVDVVADDIDILVAGGYKWLCGPFGAAVCWLRPELREAFDPPFVGWRSTVDPYTFDARTMPIAPTARSMEYSTMGYGSAVALGRALEYVNELGVDRVLAHDQALAARLADGLRSLGATVLTPEDDAHRGGIVTARYPGPGRRGGRRAAERRRGDRLAAVRRDAVLAPLLQRRARRRRGAARARDVLGRRCCVGSRLLNSRAIESVYGLLGVRPVINAAGIYTDLGGSVLSPTVRDAVHEVNGTFASMTELLDRSGERLAELLGVEAARVVPGRLGRASRSPSARA